MMLTHDLFIAEHAAQRRLGSHELHLHGLLPMTNKIRFESGVIEEESYLCCQHAQSTCRLLVLTVMTLPVAVQPAHCMTAIGRSDS